MNPNTFRNVTVGSLLTNLLGMALVLCLIHSPAQAATELAKINDKVITLEDFNRKYQENLKFFQVKVPTKKEVLEDLVKRELGVQEAKRLGLDKDPEIADRMNTVLYHALLDKKLTQEMDKVHITDGDAKSYYATSPEVRTSHIFVAVRLDMSMEQKKNARERIQKIYDDQVKPGKLSFSEIAQKYSDGAAAPAGGDIDYQTKEKLDPIYYQTALDLKTPGKVSGIIQTPFGYHIIKLTAVRPWEEVDKAQIKRTLMEQKRNLAFEKLMNGLKSAAKVSIKEQLISTP